MPDEISWIKLDVDFFGDDKIKQIRAMPDGDAMLLIWLNLLVMAGKTNDSGLVYLTQGVPYTDEMLSVALGRPIMTVRCALETFTMLRMVERLPEGLFISNWEKHQNIDGMDRARVQSKIRMRNYRERKRLEAGQKEDCCVTVTQPVTQRYADVTHQNKKEDIENKKEERDKPNSYVNPSDDTLKAGNSKAADAVNTETEKVSVNVQAAAAENPKTAVCVSIGKAWNKTGFVKVRGFPVNSPRGQAIDGLVSQYGIETVLACIELAKQSEFLHGLGDRITLDWFLTPANFQKVLEGNYARKWERLPRIGEEQSGADRLLGKIARGEYDE